MPQCQAFGCSNKRGDVTADGDRISCFSIPDPKKEPGLCAKWLHAIGTDKFNPNTYVYHVDRVVCDQHFSKDCFEEDMMAKLMGTTPKRKKLVPGAVPTIFSFRKQLACRPKDRPNTAKRIQAKERKEVSFQIFLHQYSSRPQTSPAWTLPTVYTSIQLVYVQWYRPRPA